MTGKTKLKLAVVALGLIPIFWIGSCFDYYLPHTRKVQLVGVEVKRMDAENSKEGDARSRDVRFVQAREPGGTEPIVFRNEDTRWGWPPYFKFDSGDMAAYAEGIVKNSPDATVMVTYYGWRIRPLSWYPNAVALEIVEPNESHFPVFNTVFFVLLAGAVSYPSYRVFRWLRRRKKRKAAEAGGAAGEVAVDTAASAELAEGDEDGSGEGAPTEASSRGGESSDGDGGGDSDG